MALTADVDRLAERALDERGLRVPERRCDRIAGRHVEVEPDDVAAWYVLHRDALKAIVWPRSMERGDGRTVIRSERLVVAAREREGRGDHQGDPHHRLFEASAAVRVLNARRITSWRTPRESVITTLSPEVAV